MTYERLKQFLILSICSVLLLGLIADDARAQLCALVGGDGSSEMVRQPGGGCKRQLKTDFDGAGTSITGGFYWGDDDETNFFSGTGKKSFPDWVTDDIKRGRNDDEFCTNVVEKLDAKCGEDGRYISLSDDQYSTESGYATFCQSSSHSAGKCATSADAACAFYGGNSKPGYRGQWNLCGGKANPNDSGESWYGDIKVHNAGSCPSNSTWTDKGCLLDSSESYISNDDLAKKFNDLNMSDFVETSAFDQYMEELEKIGIHWTGKVETEKKKVEEKTDYHPDGTQSLTELYESKEYSYDGQTNSNNNKLYPTQEKTHSTTVVDGKTTSSGTSTRPGKGANSGEPGNGSGDGDGPLDAKVDGSQIGLGESPEIPELYQQKYKNTDWAEIVEDGLQDNPMLDNLKGIGSQYTTGVCPSFEQEFFGELIVIDVPCELLDMIRAFFLTISSISAFWIIFRRA